MDGTTCNGCVFLGGEVVANQYFFAKCNKGYYPNGIAVVLGHPVPRPAECKYKLLNQPKHDAMSIYDPEYVYIVTMRTQDGYETFSFPSTSGDNAAEYVLKPNFISLFKQSKR
jgi:hypothetical protein